MLDITVGAIECVNVTVPVDTAVEGVEDFDGIFEVTLIIGVRPVQTLMLGEVIISDPPDCT